MIKFFLILFAIGIIVKFLEAMAVPIVEYIASNPVVFGVGVLVALLLIVGLKILKWYRQKKYGKWIYNIKNEIFIVDCLNGKEFESWCGSLLEKLQYTNIQLTPAIGDQGADIIATYDGLRYAIQCKHYSSNVGNKPVQEVLSARRIYECDAMMVMTNSHFTPGGKEAARANNVKLIDREGLIQMMSIANELFIRSEKATNRAIRKGKRLAKKKVKKEYSEEQLIEYKDHLDNLPHWKMVGEDEIVEE